MLGRILFKLTQKYPQLTISFSAQDDHLKILLLTKDGRYGAMLLTSITELPELPELLASKVREIVLCPK